MFPTQKDDRAKEIVTDVIELMDMGDKNTNKTRKRVERWLKLLLSHLNAYPKKPWWFTISRASCELSEGTDIIDIDGAFYKPIALMAPSRLIEKPLQFIEEQRALASTGKSNAGDVSYYAFQGHRIHLWPAPSKTVRFSLVYSSPLNAAQLPEEWVPLLIDGIIGRYGRHFDKDAMMDDMSDFERRFMYMLKRINNFNFDMAISEQLTAIATANINTTSDSLVKPITLENNSILIPQTTSGIGHSSVTFEIAE